MIPGPPSTGAGESVQQNRDDRDPTIRPVDPFGARGRIFNGPVPLRGPNGVGSIPIARTTDQVGIAKISDAGSDELRGFAVQQAMEVVGLLIKALCIDRVACRFEPSGESKGTVVTCLKV